MKPTWGLVALAAVAGVLVGTKIFRAADSSCCNRLARAAADKIDGALGGTGLVADVLNGTGISSWIPGLLDDLGVPA